MQSAYCYYGQELKNVNRKDVRFYIFLPAMSQSCSLTVCVSDQRRILSAKSTPTVPL